ncbi:MAG TPA: BON domain-containing protein [Azospirillaceae bacterium]|nr:BON domain-containing protein [Azospirillaceae bacterium]
MADYDDRYGDRYGRDQGRHGRYDEDRPDRMEGRGYGSQGHGSQGGFNQGGGNYERDDDMRYARAGGFGGGQRGVYRRDQGTGFGGYGSGGSGGGYGSGYGVGHGGGYGAQPGHENREGRGRDYSHDMRHDMERYARGAYGGHEERDHGQGRAGRDYGADFGSNPAPFDRGGYGGGAGLFGGGSGGRDYGGAGLLDAGSMNGMYGDTYGRSFGGTTSRDMFEHSGRGGQGRGSYGGSNYGGASSYGGQSRHEGRRGGDDRGFFARAGDEIASWFGADDARQRREMDARHGDAGAQHHRGRGPRNYTRSDDRIRDDVNDRLTDDPYVDASEIDVTVSGGEVTLSGTVDTRHAKRRAEDIAEEISGVTHVQNNLRVRQQQRGYGMEHTGLGMNAGSMGTTGSGLGAAVGSALGMGGSNTGGSNTGGSGTGGTTGTTGGTGGFSGATGTTGSGSGSTGSSGSSSGGATGTMTGTTASTGGAGSGLGGTTGGGTTGSGRS